MVKLYCERGISFTNSCRREMIEMKKFLSVLAATTMLFSVAAMSASAESTNESTINIYEMVKGRDLDLNDDGNVNDADWAAYFVYGLYLDGNTPYKEYFEKVKKNGDLDNNDVIDGDDMMILCTVVSGKMKDYLPGDVNLDGVVNGTDATLALNCYTQLSAGVSQNDILYYDFVKDYGDMDGNGQITGSDATAILNIYTELSAT